MQCWRSLVNSLSWWMVLAGLAHMVMYGRSQAPYGRYLLSAGRTVPARLAWFLQEIPALLVPLLLLLFSPDAALSTGRNLLLATFCLHYFHRTFVYSLLTRGQPVPLSMVITAGLFCTGNGFLQGHSLLHCAQLDDSWLTDYRCILGLVLFYLGMAINIHSDCILRNLRRPGEVVYKIPTGGVFEYVSSANYLGEIVEWFGYAIATWSLPALTFAVFSLSFIGPRAHQHHRYYHEKFRDYPRIRKALIPFIF